MLTNSEVAKLAAGRFEGAFEHHLGKIVAEGQPEAPKRERSVSPSAWKPLRLQPVVSEMTRDLLGQFAEQEAARRTRRVLVCQVTCLLVS